MERVKQTLVVLVALSLFFGACAFSFVLGIEHHRNERRNIDEMFERTKEALDRRYRTLLTQKPEWWVESLEEGD